jgi:hypothetical protein
MSRKDWVSNDLEGAAEFERQWNLGWEDPLDVLDEEAAMYEDED